MAANPTEKDFAKIASTCLPILRREALRLFCSEKSDIKLILITGLRLARAISIAWSKIGARLA
jgi:hypothetical protein